MKKNGETTLADVVEAIKALGDRLDARIDLLGDRLDARIDLLDLHVNGRLDGVLKLLGGHYRDHQRRITALERRSRR